VFLFKSYFVDLSFQFRHTSIFIRPPPLMIALAMVHPSMRRGAACVLLQSGEEQVRLAAVLRSGDKDGRQVRLATVAPWSGAGQLP